MKPCLKYSCLILLLCFSSGAGAQVPFQPRRLGLSSSPKSFGLILDTDSNRKEKTFNSYALFLDCYQLLSGEEEKPGYKASYSHNTIIRQGYLNEGMVYFLYAGSGGVLGYVRDYSSATHKNRGLELGLTAGGGILLAFKDSKWEIGLSFLAEFALHIRQDESVSHKTDLSWYANGLFRAPLPMLNVYYRF